VSVLVTGAGGQLGLDLLDGFADRGVTGLTHRELDVTDEAAVTAAIRDHRPRVVINTAAWTDVDGCEQDPARAHRIHALGPWYLARACSLVGARLVTISTDHVFGGAVAYTAPGGPRARSEFDPVAPVNAYGRSKAAGEQLVREALPEHHIVRTAWLAGARGDNFVRTVLDRGRRLGELAVVDDQVGSPTFTRDLATAIREIVAAGRPGTVNRTNAGWCSRYELAVATFELAGLDVAVHRQTSAAVGGAAARPAWSVLDDTHATAIGLSGLPHWRRGLERLLDELGVGTPDPDGSR
jgi:dTDP-4-dehydrorhamnose reductase